MTHETVSGPSNTIRSRIASAGASVAGGERADARRELDRLRVRVAPVREEAELARLVGAGLGDLGAAVADVHAVQGAEPVEVAAAVLVVDVAAVAAHDDRDLVLRVERAHAGEVQPHVLARQLLQLGRREFLDRGHAPPRIVHFVDVDTPNRTSYTGHPDDSTS